MKYFQVGHLKSDTILNSEFKYHTHSYLSLLFKENRSFKKFNVNKLLISKTQESLDVSCMTLNEQCSWHVVQSTKFKRNLNIFPTLTSSWLRR